MTTSSDLPPGKLGVFALLGAATGSVPLPWVSRVLARRVCGAMVHDIAARHGLSLSPAARGILATHANAKSEKGALRDALAYVGKKVLVRFGPLGMVPPLRAALEVFALGHLFDRYVRQRRSVGAIRLGEDEVTAVRLAVDRAVVGALTLRREVGFDSVPAPPEELRDELTQALDGLLSATTSVPSWLLLHLESSFDEALAAPAIRRIAEGGEP